MKKFIILCISIGLSVNSAYSQIQGTAGANTLKGNNNGTNQKANINDTINGLGGDDIIYGYNGSDILDGGDGNDALYAGPGIDTVKGGNGDDKIFGAYANNTDTFTGGSGKDTFYIYVNPELPLTNYNATITDYEQDTDNNIQIIYKKTTKNDEPNQRCNNQKLTGLEKNRSGNKFDCEISITCTPTNGPDVTNKFLVKFQKPLKTNIDRINVDNSNGNITCDRFAKEYVSKRPYVSNEEE